MPPVPSQAPALPAPAPQPLVPTALGPAVVAPPGDWPWPATPAVKTDA